MGVLDEAIREHLDLKRRRGASEEELARAEAEALGPPRRSAAPLDSEGADDEPGPAADSDSDDDAPSVEDVQETRVLGTHADDDRPPAPSPSAPASPPRVLHDIDEDPLAPPPPVARAPVDEPPGDDEPPPLSGRLSE